LFFEQGGAEGMTMRAAPLRAGGGQGVGGLFGWPDPDTMHNGQFDRMLSGLLKR